MTLIVTVTGWEICGRPACGLAGLRLASGNLHAGTRIRLRVEDAPDWFSAELRRAAEICPDALLTVTATLEENDD